MMSPGDALEIEAGEAAEIGVGAEQRLDAMAAREQFVDEVRADETGRAGDKAIHINAEPCRHRDRRESGHPRIKPVFACEQTLNMEWYGQMAEKRAAKAKKLVAFARVLATVRAFRTVCTKILMGRKNKLDWTSAPC